MNSASELRLYRFLLISQYIYTFSKNRLLGRFFLVVAMSVCIILSPPHAILPGEQRRSQGSKASLSPRWELVHHLQFPDEKMCSWLPSELCLFDENSSITCNLLMIKYVPDGHQNSVSSMRTRPSPAITWWKNVIVSVLLSASVEKFFVSRMRDFM